MVKETLTVEITADQLEAIYHLAKKMKRQMHLANTVLMRDAERVMGFVEHCENLLAQTIDWDDE